MGRGQAVGNGGRELKKLCVLPGLSGVIWGVRRPATPGRGRSRHQRDTGPDWCCVPTRRSGAQRSWAGSARAGGLWCSAEWRCGRAVRRSVRGGGAGPQELTRGETPQSIDAPVGARTRLRAWRARGLPAGSPERQAEELGRVREDLRLGHGAGVPRRDLPAGEGQERAPQSIGAPSGARKKQL
ncbi:hypothetical protein NDU88_000661 [Pleurodeles waltl]|uniref:Uncharacterized protein n=1 Tax=Pleurodeles waltl TaxID=8319 RepID=A0AAV7VY02_PLEWA|nr:hypothetical protein NDU88_000661 [Pleurodeles waltl]